MAASARGNLKITRYTSLSSEQPHVLDSALYKLEIQAVTKAVRVKVITADAANWWLVPAGTFKTFENVNEMRSRTIYFIEDSASAEVQLLEYRNDVTAIS